jgi:hypothetical protein
MEAGARDIQLLPTDIVFDGWGISNTLIDCKNKKRETVFSVDLRQPYSIVGSLTVAVSEIS